MWTSPSKCIIKPSGSDNPLRTTGQKHSNASKTAPRSVVNRVGVSSDSKTSSSVFGAYLFWPSKFRVARDSHSLLNSVLSFSPPENLNTQLDPCSLEKNPTKNLNHPSYQHNQTVKRIIIIQVNFSSFSVLKIHCNLVWEHILHFPAPRKELVG